MVSAVVSDIATGRRPAGRVPPPGATWVIAAVGPLALPPPKTYTLEPSVVAPTSWTAAGSAPTRRGAPGATRTTSATEPSAAFRPPTARTDVPTRASPGNCTGAGRARDRTTCSSTPMAAGGRAVALAGEVAGAGPAR